VMRPLSPLHLISPSVLLVVAASLCGCATGPPPMEQLTRARTLVEQAEKAQAGRYATNDLQRAHDELSAAETANQHGQSDEARRQAEAAAVDADVATARAGEAQSVAALDQVKRGNEALRRNAAPGARGTTPEDLDAYPAPSPGAPVSPTSPPPQAA